MVWYSHLFQNFPQLIVIHTVKGFGIVNKAEINVFLELSCFFDDPADVGYKEEVTKQYYSIISLFFLIRFFFGCNTWLQDKWDLNSPTRDQTCATCSEAWCLTSLVASPMEIPYFFFFFF